MTAPLRCIIDGRERPVGNIAPAFSKFNRPHLWAERPHYRYSLSVPLSDVDDALAKLYTDLRDDVVKHPEPGPLDEQMRRLHCSSIAEFRLAAPEAFVAFANLFGIDLLNAIEMRHGSDRIDHVLISIDSIALARESLELHGFAVSAPPAAAR